MPGLESPFEWKKNNVVCIGFELKHEGEPQ